MQDHSVLPPPDQPLPILFGANVDPLWADDADPVGRALDAEDHGLDFITIQDHPYQRAFYDAWTLLTFIAARTERITVVPTVACLPLRPPAMLAKSAVSLDHLTGGRVQLGLGAGAFWTAIAAMGGPERSAREAADALTEAVDVIHAMWSGERSVRVPGEHYHLDGTKPGPTPDGRLGIWLGAYGPRMLRLTGAKAEGWMPSLGFLPLAKLPAAVARVDEAAREAGRDPAGIRKIYNLSGMIGAESATPFAGSAAQWADEITRLVTEHGMNGFAYWPDDDHDRQLAVFADEVVPRVREQLG